MASGSEPEDGVGGSELKKVGMGWFGFGFGVCSGD
jgi:hypothetical protein